MRGISFIWNVFPQIVSHAQNVSRIVKVVLLFLDANTRIFLLRIFIGVFLRNVKFFYLCQAVMRGVRRVGCNRTPTLTPPPPPNPRALKVRLLWQNRYPADTDKDKIEIVLTIFRLFPRPVHAKMGRKE